MARKFLTMDEAATMLGISPDTLNEMRERQKIYGYRDGGSWKFKSEDVEKLLADRAAIEEEGEFAELDEDPDSILLSEVELGSSDESTSSTIIGGKSTRKDAKESVDSDIQLAQPKHDSDVNLDSALATDIKGGSDVLEAGSGVSPMFDELDTLDLEMPSAADSGISSGLTSLGTHDPAAAVGGGSDITLGSDALKLEGSALSFGEGEHLELGEAPHADSAASKDGGSAIDLEGDEDGDLVLGGSSHGDLSRSGDSGISLFDPADSGLSLESAPLELGGSAVESLELGEDDMMVADNPSASDAAEKSGAQAPPQSDDDFLLAPLEEAGAEESDSGSQVIALEGEVEFDEASASSVATGPASGLGGGLLEEDLGAGLSGAGLSGAGLSGVGGTTPALTPAAAPALAAAHAAAAMSSPGGMVAAPEAPFSGWNVASLVLCAVLLMVCGMFTFDMLRNMWSWSGPYSVNSSMMDMVLSMF